MWNHYGTLLRGIPTCFLSKASFTGDLTACQEVLTYLLSGFCMSVECAFWLPEEEVTSLRTRFQSDTRFDSWTVFARYNYHNICRGRRVTRCAAAGIRKSLPCSHSPAESFIENPSLSVHCLSNAVSKLFVSLSLCSSLLLTDNGEDN